MKRLILLIVLFLSLVTTQQADAWYGAGYSSGWPNTIDGAKGKVTTPFYKAAPDFYDTGDTIVIPLQLENPSNNPKVISTDLYMKIWKVENLAEGREDFTEEQLYLAHIAKKDTQSSYKTLPLGLLEIPAGQSSDFQAEFVIETPGYYQFDVTDLGPSSTYKPGHIYTAGFLRVKSGEVLGDKDIQGIQDKNNILLISALTLLLSLLLLLILFLFIIRRKKRANQKNKSPLLDQK